MAEVLLFHHVLGRTAGVDALADELRAAGHTVHTPDLFDGRTFPSIDAGAEHAGEVGFDVLVERGVRAADGLPDAITVLGISFGVMPAQTLAQTRPGVRGAVLLEACLPASELGTWPAGVPVQVHGMDADPFFAGEGDLDAARARRGGRGRRAVRLPREPAPVHGPVAAVPRPRGRRARHPARAGVPRPARLTRRRRPGARRAGLPAQDSAASRWS